MSHLPRRELLKMILAVVLILGVIPFVEEYRVEKIWKINTPPQGFELVVGQTVSAVPLANHYVNPAEAKYTHRYKQLEWSTDDPHIAAVDDKGLITAVKTGTTIVRVRFHGFETSAPVIVK